MIARKQTTLDAVRAMKNLSPFRRLSGTGHTEVKVTDNIASLYLHGNCIAEYDAENNRVMITDAGWQTHTTKERLLGVMEQFGLGSIYQEKWKWYVKPDGEDRIMVDNHDMIFFDLFEGKVEVQRHNN